MRKLLILTLPFFLLISSLAADTPSPEQEEIPTGFAQRGYLDDGRLLTARDKNWKEVIDTLAGLGFNYIASAGVEADKAVLEYLDEQGLPLRSVTFLDEFKAGTDKQPALLVIRKESQKQWAGGMLEAPEGSELLWADNGSGKFESWPYAKEGSDFGVLLHAGNSQNGPVQDPYPALIGDSLAEARKRGLMANILIAAPALEAFTLNIEAAATALSQGENFDGDKFYQDWASSEFGEKAAITTVKSLKLLHGAHGTTPGFAGISEQTAEIVASLEQNKPVKHDPNPVNDALRLARRSLELAQLAAEKDVPASKSNYFASQVLLPAEIYVQNLELLESLTQLSSAWQIYHSLPANPVSRQRVEGLLTDAQNWAGTLRASLAKGTAGTLLNNAQNRVPEPETIAALAAKL